MTRIDTRLLARMVTVLRTAGVADAAATARTLLAVMRAEDPGTPGGATYGPGDGNPPRRRRGRRRRRRRAPHRDGDISVTGPAVLMSGRRTVTGAPYGALVCVPDELHAEPADAAAAAGVQLALLDGPAGGPGRGRAGAVPSTVWQQLLDHAPTLERYRNKVHRRSADQCWYWLAAISDTGHGKIKAGRAGGTPVVVSAHVYGYQLTYGLIQPRPGEDPVVAHRCDEASCQNPAHLELVERRVNGADFRARRWRAQGPLADVRGAEGRAVAIRKAIRAALATGAGPEKVEAAITAAATAGLQTVPALF